MQSQSFCMISYKATSLFMIIQYAANRPWIWYLICILSHTDNKFKKFVLQLSWHCCFKQEVQSLWLPTSWDKAMINLQSPRNLRCCCTDYFQYTCCNRFFTWLTLCQGIWGIQCHTLHCSAGSTCFELLSSAAMWDNIKMKSSTSRGQSLHTSSIECNSQNLTVAHKILIAPLGIFQRKNCEESTQPHKSVKHRLMFMQYCYFIQVFQLWYWVNSQI